MTSWTRLSTKYIRRGREWVRDKSRERPGPSENQASPHDAYGSNVCTCFAIFSFNFGLPTYFVSHYCYGRALKGVFYGNVFLKKRRAELLTVVWQRTCQRSHICWCASCWHHVFVLLVQFALAHLTIFKILSGITRDWRHFASRRLPYKSICLSNVFVRSMFALIPLFVDFVRYLTFWHHTIQIYM